ncbi:MAG: CpXC domain-containing protein [Candidatus Thorarchaeota archaeon]
MTTINIVDLTCPECGHQWKEQIHPSICTWLNPELITKMYESGTELSCPECPVKIHVEGKMLINHPGGMFMLNLGSSHEVVKQTLIEQGVISADGIVKTERVLQTSHNDMYI